MEAATDRLQTGKLDLGIVAGIVFGAIPAVLVAAFLVKSMPVEVLRSLASAVVLYSAVIMLRSAAAERRKSASAGQPPRSSSI
jgi:uncharacterized membrane protein YfcA